MTYFDLLLGDGGGVRSPDVAALVVVAVATLIERLRQTRAQLHAGGHANKRRQTHRFLPFRGGSSSSSSSGMMSSRNSNRSLSSSSFRNSSSLKFSSAFSYFFERVFSNLLSAFLADVSLGGRR